MRADALLLCVAVLAPGCASLPPAPGRGRHLSDTPRMAGSPALTQPLMRHRDSRFDVPGADPDSVEEVVGGKQRATLARRAVLEAIDDVKGSTDSVASAISQLAARPPGLGNRGLSGLNGAFTRYVTHGASQLPWLRGALGSATTLADVASEVADPDMELGLLRMAGPRFQAALFGSMLLAAWLDFLQLADIVLRECPAYSVEKLLMDLHRVQRRMEPTLAALASQAPEQVEAAATAMPGLMGQLTREFGVIRDGARTAMENHGKLMTAMQLVEMLTLVSTLRVSLPRLPPAAPATIGVGLVMSSGGVMAGSRIVVSAEWVEMIRRLVQAGVISAPAVSAAVRIHAGQVMMAQANGDLPQGVRDALGDGPEVRGMRVTGRAGAGMSGAPKHHVLPREHREWFEKRGFTGDMDIDQFCVRLEQSRHEAIHGGGNWRLGRTWPGEWNRMLMKALDDAETVAGRILTQGEVLRIVAHRMRSYNIPMSFTPW
jgi:hypothetical protein